MVRILMRGRRPKEGHCYAIRATGDRRIRCHITVASIEEGWMDDQPAWTIRFQKGDHSDKPRLLAARPGLPHGDYVTDALRALRGSAEEVSSDAHARFVTE